MFETYKMFHAATKGMFSGKSTNQLIQEFQQTQNGDILAELYIRCFGYIVKTSDRYKSLTHHDKASFALEEMDKCVTNFQLNTGHTLLTAYGKYLNNRLASENNLTKQQKRKANYLINKEPIDGDELDRGYFGVTFDNHDVFILEDSLDTSGFTESERQICCRIAEGFKDKQIAEELGITPQAVYKCRSRIKKRITKEMFRELV